MRHVLRSALMVAAWFFAGGSGLLADESPKKIEGWGEFEDPAGGTKIELIDKTLVMTSPAEYVDNYTRGRVNAPRVTQNVSGNFTVEVKVVHVDKALPNSVLESLGNFPTAYHAASLLIRQDDGNFIRFEKVSMNKEGRQSITCDLQVYDNYERVAQEVRGIKDSATNLRLERRGKELLVSYSQDDGKTWSDFPKQKIDFLQDELKVAVSMTNNTNPGCTVKFQGLMVGKGKK